MRHYGLTPLRAAELTPAFPLRYGASGQVDEIAAEEEEQIDQAEHQCSAISPAADEQSIEIVYSVEQSQPLHFDWQYKEQKQFIFRIENGESEKHGHEQEVVGANA